MWGGVEKCGEEWSNLFWTLVCSVSDEEGEWVNSTRPDPVLGGSSAQLYRVLLYQPSAPPPTNPLLSPHPPTHSYLLTHQPTSLSLITQPPPPSPP